MLMDIAIFTTCLINTKESIDVRHMIITRKRSRKRNFAHELLPQSVTQKAVKKTMA